jgi:hypothetical protein
MGSKRALLIGLAGEYRVMSELLLRGHNPSKSYLAAGPDIVLENGFRLEIKSKHRHRDKSGPYEVQFFSGHTRRNVRPTGFDFVIVWCIDDDAFFIIPIDALPASSFGLWPDSKKSRYSRFKEAWHLLEKGTAEVPMNRKEPGITRRSIKQFPLGI